MHKLLILINGMPCTGKTYLAAYLHKQLELPVITKDDIKIMLFE